MVGENKTTTKPYEPHRRHPEQRDKDTQHVNREEEERLLNQTVVLTEVTNLQLILSWPSRGRKWPWNKEIARQAWLEEVLL